MIDVEILIDELYKELEEVSQKHIELEEKLEIVKSYAKTVDRFVCNISYILDMLSEAAKNEQRAESVNHFINLIEHEVLKGEK
jgi:uncharacterized protein YfcZ (UPF0381/DUF406 family)